MTLMNTFCSKILLFKRCCRAGRGNFFFFFFLCSMHIDNEKNKTQREPKIIAYRLTIGAEKIKDYSNL